mmetsp:Transcript_3935/g.8679  ORF Transcript_3935/g.8679 Transcript_3935/m.8679 type:complete len:430 (+) Transcript_3935:101-1390(+)
MMLSSRLGSVRALFSSLNYEKKWVVYTGEESFHFRKDVTHVKVHSNVSLVPARAFVGCTNLKVVDLANATLIGPEAFLRCESLKRIFVPSSVIVIGDEAFSSCVKLEKVQLSEGLETIGAGAFCKCSSLECIKIPSTVVTIGARAFSDCKDIKDAELFEGTETIGEAAFYKCISLERIKIPSTLTAIHDYAFSKCYKLKKLYLSDVTTIGEGAFYSCHSLERVDIPSNVTMIAEGTFFRCIKLKEVDLSNVTAIGRNAFWQCTSLKQIKIPSSVTIIGGSAFHGCARLQEVEIFAKVLEIESAAFRGCRNFCTKISSSAFVIAPQTCGSRLWKTTAISPHLGETALISTILTENRISKVIQGERTWKQKLDHVRDLCRLFDASSILELAIWKANMNEGNEKLGCEARQLCRTKCGSAMSIIIEGVLSFF